MEGRHTVMGVAEKLAEEVPGHDKDYYYRHLMQLPKVSKAKRPITEWQAYLHIELKRWNKGTSRRVWHTLLEPLMFPQRSSNWRVRRCAATAFPRMS